MRHPKLAHILVGIMATAPVAFLAKSEKKRGRKINFPHRAGSVTFFGETRDTIYSIYTVC